MKVINVVVTESTIFQRRYRVPDDFDVADAAAIEALFVNDDRSVDGVVGVVGRDVKPVAVSALSDAAYDVDYSVNAATVSSHPKCELREKN